MSRAVAADGRVHAFEPAAANRRFLERHIALNDIANIDVVASVVGATQSDAVTFYEHPRASGMNARAAPRGRAYRATQRPQTTIDAYCATHALYPEIIKIDVEGAEIAVLEGAATTVVRDRPLIFVSAHPAAIAASGERPEKLFELARRYDYAIRDVDGAAVDTLALDEYVMAPREIATC